LIEDKIDYKAAIEACEAYIPQILGLVESFSSKISDADEALKTGLSKKNEKLKNKRIRVHFWIS
jgi:hypothetical protein